MPSGNQAFRLRFPEPLCQYVSTDSGQTAANERKLLGTEQKFASNK